MVASLLPQLHKLHTLETLHISFTLATGKSLEYREEEEGRGSNILLQMLLHAFKITADHPILTETISGERTTVLAKSLIEMHASEIKFRT